MDTEKFIDDILKEEDIEHPYTRGADRLDFHDMSVESLRRIIKKGFDKGFKQGYCEALIDNGVDNQV